ncbi:hypothetical protein SDC9_173865 [bioreactor metagenome]|uniref:Uncharacterized protein n=1 Tax=bioreactor metagenome TaxID=1076179 RepID=A0A645GJW7_9ZZZZ
MVQPVVIMHALHRRHIAGVAHHADHGMVTVVTSAYAAQLAHRIVAAYIAKAYRPPPLDQGV